MRLLAYFSLSLLTTAVLAAQGFKITDVSLNVTPASLNGLTQIAFNPADPAHVFIARTSVASSLTEGGVTRFDYDAETGQLSNPVNVATGLGRGALGLAFYRNELYVSIDIRDDGRISRLSRPGASGVYLDRHDFVWGIPTGGHSNNQLQISGHSLYVGIGARGRKGDPQTESVYTMTIGRIADLRFSSFNSPLTDFKTATNNLAPENQWVDPTPADGLLRYYASGFRNPFGIAIDADGDLWVSSNGNDDEGFLSPDLLYRKVPMRGQGAFPPPEFGFGRLIEGIPIEPFVDLGQSPAATGFDFVPDGPEKGKVVLTQFGQSGNGPAGRNVLLIDPETGESEVLIDGLQGPIDAAADPFGRLLVGDLFGKVYLVEPPPPPPPSPPITDDSGLVVPQVALGGGLECVLFVSNKTDTSWQGHAYLRQGDAAGWQGTVTANGEPVVDSRIPIDLPSKASAKFTLRAADGDTVQIGYLNVFGEQSWGHLALGFFYNLIEDGRLQDSTGTPTTHLPTTAVEGTGLAEVPQFGRFSFPVELSESVNTGLALTHGLREADEQVAGQTIQATLFDESGAAIRTAELLNNGHRAQFVNEIWEDLPEAFVGMLQLEPLDDNEVGDVDYFVTVLRLEFTEDGLQLTSIPVDATADSTVATDPNAIRKVVW